MPQDIVNALFGIVGAILAYNNIIEAKKHQEIKGIHWYSTAFFTIWGIWNLYLYPHLNMWYSFIGSLSITFVDLYWLFLYFKYRNLK